MAQYNKAHAAAVTRIGMPVSKAMGTTPQGHRHAFGWRTKKGGLGEIETQRMMHHRSPESQRVYTQPSQKDIRDAARLGYERLQLNVADTPSLLPMPILQALGINTT